MNVSSFASRQVSSYTFRPSSVSSTSCLCDSYSDTLNVERQLTAAGCSICFFSFLRRDGDHVESAVGVAHSSGFWLPCTGRCVLAPLQRASFCELSKTRRGAVLQNLDI